MKKDVALNPFHACLIGAQAVVFDSVARPGLIEQEQRSDGEKSGYARILFFIHSPKSATLSSLIPQRRS